MVMIRIMVLDSKLGVSLMRIGSFLEAFADTQTGYAEGIKRSLLSEIASLHENLKDFERLRKKLENRRLDYDAKQNKASKGKKSVELDEELKIARDKYEESLNDTEKLMRGFKEREVVYFV